MTVNKWVPEVNTFDSMIVDFEGWISVKGLPFSSWTSHTFKSISGSCGFRNLISTETLCDNLVRMKKRSYITFRWCIRKIKKEMQAFPIGPINQRQCFSMAVDKAQGQMDSLWNIFQDCWEIFSLIF